jgi:NSS family neurotransmitter:Na+ symporter
MQNRGSWGSRIGFILAVAGSAVGLANIWRFPYITGVYGGASFIALYLMCLFMIGFPVFISEILIGRSTQTSPSGAFELLGKNRLWGWIGKGTIVTGFLVSSFYSAVAGWILGYLVEAFRGTISSFQSPEQASTHFTSLLEHPLWGLSFHFFFLVLCVSVLYLGVLKGIERWNKILMPMLIGLLFLIVIKGLTLPNAWEGVTFLLSPDWSLITPTAILVALGQAFFTLSLGQGTMVTYGSYTSKNESLLKTCFPVVLVDLLVSTFAAVAIFSIVFSVGMEPSSGPGLLFNTLPWVFSQITGGYLMAVLFFIVVVIAALTSEISAMEPTIAYLMDEWGWKRHKAVLVCGTAVFIVGIPSALSYSVLSNFTIFGEPFVGFMDFICSAFFIPLGGLAAVVLVGWFWGVNNAINELKEGSGDLFDKRRWLLFYFWFCFKYCAPLLIVLVFLNALGVFG